MSFEEYLVSKRIDPKRFHLAEPQVFEEWRNIFEKVHPESFTAQKKFLINPIRRKYLIEQS